MTTVRLASPASLELTSHTFCSARSDSERTVDRVSTGSRQMGNRASSGHELLLLVKARLGEELLATQPYAI
ncbi:hypothetical protein AFLA_013002 [Aspergillus flavus NRRL3357]|nr:hypothetical protein AFLA_013002 [Aspergillus flavus NRRL3357]